MAPEKELTRVRPAAPAFPAASLSIALATGAIFCFPTSNAALIYSRTALLHGQLWRAWTGHMVHFSASHFLWNLIIFLVAGCWLESIRPLSARWFYVLCPPVIAATLLFGDPTLERYAGLSGLATGVLIFLALVQLSENDAESTWFWVAVFGLVALKIALETVTGVPLLVHDVAGFRVVPLAHLSGACSGIIGWVATRRFGRTTAS